VPVSVSGGDGNTSAERRSFSDRARYRSRSGLSALTTAFTICSGEPQQRYKAGRLTYCGQAVPACSGEERPLNAERRPVNKGEIEDEDDDEHDWLRPSRGFPPCSGPRHHPPS
jgi:hypothetical protein